MRVLKMGNMKSEDDLFDFMRFGKKTIDTRANTPKYQDICIGDKLVFESIATKDKIIRRVKAIRWHETIAEAVKHEDYTKILPGLKTLEEITQAYYYFPDYEEKIKKWGLVVFELE